jgi:hypothetical protein
MTGHHPKDVYDFSPLDIILMSQLCSIKEEE